MEGSTDTLTRGFAVLEIKSVDAEKRELSGWATTPATDRVGDQVMPEGAVFAPEIPLLLHHDATQPVGRTFLGHPTARGIPFTARIPRVEEPGKLKDRVDEAWHSVKAGVIAAVSIGFRVLQGGIERIESGSKFTKFEIMELSLTPLPANAQALITSVKAAALLERPQPARAATLPRSTHLRGEISDLSRRKSALLAQIQAQPANSDTWFRLIKADDLLDAELKHLQSRQANLIAGLPEDFGLTTPHDVAKALEARIERLEARAVKRVNEAIATAEASALARHEKSMEIWGAAIGQVLREHVQKELDERVSAYESTAVIVRHEGLHEAGVWNDGVPYSKGAVVTQGGGAWVAQADNTGQRPGDGATAWRLMVRRGKDGKHGEDADPQTVMRLVEERLAEFETRLGLGRSR